MKTTTEYIRNMFIGAGIGGTLNAATRKITGNKIAGLVVGGASAYIITWKLNNDARDIKRAINDFRLRREYPDWVGN